MIGLGGIGVGIIGLAALGATAPQAFLNVMGVLKLLWIMTMAISIGLLFLYCVFLIIHGLYLLLKNGAK